MEFKDQLKRHIDRLNQVINLEDVATRHGLKRPGGSKGNWCAPHHADKNPSLSIYQKQGKWLFKDFSASASDNGASGDAIAFLQYIGAASTPVEAVKLLGDDYGLPFEPEREQQAPRERSQMEWMADEVLKAPDPAVEYLTGRGVPEETVRQAIRLKALGFSTWTSTRQEPNTVGHGGPAVAFICRDLATNLPMAVDKRFIDPALNGDVKTQTHGEKAGYPWVMSRGNLSSARTVYVVESAINALCVEACKMPFTAALAVRGTGNVPNIDWRLLIGKRVILAFDADKPNDKGERPGDMAAWAAYEALVALNVAVQMVDTSTWYGDECNDVADIASKFGIETLKERLQVIEPWAIAGLPGKDGPGGKSRVFLPPHDFSIYWRYRCKPDFTTYVDKVEEDPDGGQDKMKFSDVAGFRVASLSRVTIASATSTMTGEVDAMPATVFAVSVQTARHGQRLQRRVLEDERLHNVDQWKKLGPIYHQQKFSRLLNILERTADCGARDAVNFVGLAWRDGKPIVNEGPDCYFTEPDKQCPYHLLTFNSGRREDAAKIITAYQETYGKNAMTQALVWALGGHLKAFTGFWPHMVMQADKGSGKSTQIKRLERTLSFTMFSGQSLQTEFRLITSISGTSHVVGWEELSARKQDIIDKAVAILQESYQHSVTRRGSDMTEYLLCAPVLLAGEDVPVRALTGKVVRCSLHAAHMGKLPSDSLPRFPMRQWLDFLATLRRERVEEVQEASRTWLMQAFRAAPSDTGAKRMLTNYAAVLSAWALLCEFAGISRGTGNFPQDLRAEMNAHIKETEAERDPFVQILEVLASEIENREFKFPWKVDAVDGKAALLVRPKDVMSHIQTSMRLRDIWNSLTVKTARVFASQLEKADLVVKSGLDKIIHGRRTGHLYALDMVRLQELGVYVSISEETDQSLGNQGVVLPAANDG